MHTLLLLIALTNGADSATTAWSLQSGRGVEANPIMHRPAVAVGLKAGGTLAEMLIVKQLWSTGHRRAAIVTTIGIAAVTSYDSMQNTRVARGGHR